MKTFAARNLNFLAQLKETPVDAIFNRRSIRRYQSRPVPAEMLNRILKAAMVAPTSGDQRPWHFIVIDDAEVIQPILKLNPGADALNEAPLAILVCGEPLHERYGPYWVQDCSAATENILIEAVHLGLGAVWCGIYPREHRVSGLRQLLDIPEGVIPFSLVPLGYPAEVLPPHDCFDETRIHFNSW